MKHFWTTAAATALCALAAEAWASPDSSLFELVAAKHLRGVQSAAHSRSSRSHASARNSRSARARRAPPSAIKTEARKPIKVGRGDTLIGISRDSGVPQEVLIRLNHLRKPYVLRRGQLLKLPVRRYYVIKGGDTLYGLADRFGVPASDLAALNDMKVSEPILSGHRLYLPESAKDSQGGRAEEETSAPSRETRTYVVKPGDTLSEIADSVGVGLSELAALNNMKASDPIRVGQALTLPGGARSETTRPSSYVVKPGDTLSEIADSVGVSASDLAALNGMKVSDPIRIGQALTLPGGARSETTRPSAYVVQPGDTLYGIADRFGISASDIAAANGMRVSDPIRVGQRLDLTGAPKPRPAAPPEAAPAPIRPPPSPLMRPQPYTPPPAETAPSPSTEAPPASSNQGFELTPTAPAQPPAPAQPAYRPPPPPSRGPIIQTSPAPSSSDIVTAGRGKFVWPAAGNIVSGFGPKAGGQRNDGVDIAGTPGDPVRAAADGQVAYAGNLAEYGNLVLIKHDANWVTAYAHMGRILVKIRDQVVQGQPIGDIGQSGSADRPEVHFEIRYAPSSKDKASPVDPALLLPQR